MKEQPEKFDLKSHAIAEDKLEKLVRLFPEVCTEGGKIDFERLKLALGASVDVGKERYGMNWPGKADCFKTIQAPSMGTLLPCPDESVNFDTTENLIVEGDNLEVLKLLQKSYLGKVKVIYIDPPYNTGNDFIYPDDYTESLQTYLEYTGQVDAEGKKFGTNTEADGRFHSKWLNMMYPRLYLARNLLRDDGVIFISIDDNEFNNLYKICNEIFGEDNFINILIWKKRYNAAKEQHLAIIHDYILIYAKNRDALNDFTVPGDDEYFNNHFTEVDEYVEHRGKFMTEPLEAGNSMDDRPNLRFAIIAPDGTNIWPRRQWVWGKEKVEYAKTNGYLKFYKNREGEWKVRHKQYMKDDQGNLRRAKPFSIYDKCFTQDGTKEIENLFGNNGIFPFPKPSKLIKHLLELANDSNGVIMDFFAGSCTTGHAVLDLNNAGNGNQKFILVQLPEPCNEDSDAFKEGYKTIADIGKERVRRVIKQLDKADAGKMGIDGAKRQDRGFRVFKLAESNFKPWDVQAAQDAKALEKQLEMHIDHILEERTADDILYELLLKSGFTLTTPIEKITLAGKIVYSVAGGALFVCLEKNLTIELIRAMATKKPERVVCLDEGFASNDQLKTNTVQIFKTKGIVFKTV